MFAELKLITDMIRSSISQFRMYKSGKSREKVILDLLQTYFLLKDCVDEGEELIAEAGPDPIGKIKAMEQVSAASTLSRWESILSRQSRRLGALQGFVIGQNHLAVISPHTQTTIKEIVGSKFERTRSLHAIGAAFFFRSIFPIANSDEQRANPGRR